jgi:Uri superfamily endonuclease
MKKQNEITVDDARQVLRKDYYDDVRSMSEGIRQEFADYVKRDKPSSDDAREWLQDYIHESCDGASRVIYTSEAMDCLRYSDNDEAGIEELGSEGFDWSDGIPWSQLAYFAFRRDVEEQLSADGLDLNDPIAEDEDETEDEGAN